jgi:ParB-like chromosome segregation protein Spo0J
VAFQEMKLLHTSISEDGYTQPVVAIWDAQLQRFVIVDGFHRYTTMKRYADIHTTTGGYLPLVVLDKSIEDRMAATVRHNRARGAHSVAGMGALVFGMLKEGATPETVCHKLGLEPEELARLTHITGYSKLYGDVKFSTPVLTTAQMKAKKAYAEAHPDEHVPTDF